MTAPLDLLAARLVRATAAVRDAGIDCLVVSAPANLTYLAGLRMSAGHLVVGPAGATLVVDGRYVDAAGESLAGRSDLALELVPVGSSYEEATAALVRRLGATSVGVESAHLTVGRLAAFQRQLAADTPVQWRETTGIIESLRVIKDPWECGVLRDAGGRLSAVAACILPKVSAGRTERQVAWDIDVALRSAGFERPAFETIVASGPHAARPHHRPTDRRLETAELVLLDFGGQLDG